jgi:hypothetical protein
MSRWEGEASCEMGGRKYIGHYHVDTGMLHVSYGGCSKSTQVGGHFLNPKPLAAILVRKLVAEARKDGAA